MSTKIVSILVIEDNELVREMIQDCLECKGYEVTSAKNGLIGLEALRQLTFDVIVSDIDMPEMDGHEFLEKVKSEFQSPPPFLFVSGQEVELDKVQRNGAHMVFKKPFDLEILINYITESFPSRALS